MKGKGLVGIVLAAVVMCVGLMACNPHGHWGKGKSPEDKMAWVVKKISCRLDLNDFQEGELERISQEILDYREERKDECTGWRQQVIAMVRSESIDRGELDRLVASKLESMEEMAPFYLDKFVEFHAILSPEQREKIADFMEKHHAHHE